MQKRPKYKISKGELRGSYEKEARICRLFWKEHNMSDIEVMTLEELDSTINSFFDRFEIRQKKLNINWWYPDSPKDRIVDLRYNKQYNKK